MLDLLKTPDAALVVGAYQGAKVGTLRSVSYRCRSAMNYLGAIGRMKIYHNPRCGKSRETLELIEQAGVQPEVVQYLKTPPTVAELDGLLTMLGLEPEELMRKKEKVYKELGLSGKKLTRQQAIRVMVENPILIERPIVVEGKQAVLGRPPENVNELL